MRVALRLFAQKGYERTTIADIQAAAGLAPGSGALYKHFKSKEALLRAGVDEFVSAAAEGRAGIAAMRGDVAAELPHIGRQILDGLQRDADMMRIIWRDIDAFPSERQRVVDGRMQKSFGALAGWITRVRNSEDDANELAVIAIGSLVFFRLFTVTFTERPGGVADKDILRVWADTLSHVLQRSRPTMPRRPRTRRS